ncbi:MAG TPA: hypothetical protein VFU02_16200 [Polyangiaceae bacterium]|nr:hypothetical protein [Polyangiaceae bacterium]
MRQSVSAFVSLGVLVATLGCDPEDSAQARAKLDARTAPARTLEQSFHRIHGQLRTLQAAPCSDLTIRSAIAKSQSRSVPFIDAAALARAAKGDPLDPAAPFAHFVSKGLRERRPTREVLDEKAATDAAFDAMTLTREHDFIAAIHYDFSAPKADEHRFHGGELKGTLGLFELRSGKLVCAAPVFAQSHEEIAAKPGQTPQEAATIDLELESRRALHEAFAGMTRELNLDLG